MTQCELTIKHIMHTTLCVAAPGETIRESQCHFAYFRCLLLARGPPWSLSFGPLKAKVWSRSFRNPVLSLQVDWEPSTQRTVSLVWHLAPLTRPTPTPWPPLPETPCSPTLARPAMGECGGRASTPLQLGSHSRTGTAKPGSKVTSARAAEDL